VPKQVASYAETQGLTVLSRYRGLDVVVIVPTFQRRRNGRPPSFACAAAARIQVQRFYATLRAGRRTFSGLYVVWSIILVGSRAFAGQSLRHRDTGSETQELTRSEHQDNRAGRLKGVLGRRPPLERAVSCRMYDWRNTDLGGELIVPIVHLRGRSPAARQCQLARRDKSALHQELRGARVACRGKRASGALAV